MDESSTSLMETEDSSSIIHPTNSTDEEKPVLASNGNVVLVKEEPHSDNEDLDTQPSSCKVFKNDHSPEKIQTNYKEEYSLPSTSKCEPLDHTNALFEPIVSFEESDKPLDIPHCSSSSATSAQVDVKHDRPEGVHDENFISIKEEPSSDGEANEINPLDEAESAVPWPDSQHLLGGPSTATDYDLSDGQIETKGSSMSTYSWGICRHNLPNHFNCKMCRIESPEQVIKQEPSEPLLCFICNKIFKRQGFFEKHMKSHTDDIIIDCNHCNERLPNKKLFYKHLKDHHPGEKWYVCEICCQKFKNKALLKKHTYTHADENLFLCYFCENKFLTKIALDKHVRENHSKSQPFECELCKMCFNLVTLLKRHFATAHPEYKPYKCNVCEREFSVKKRLTEHSKVHDEGAYIQCLFCIKRFLKRKDLDVHMRTHTGERPYQCEICLDRFRQRSHLQAHLDSHSDQTYQCDHCSKILSTKKILLKHMRRKHPPLINVDSS